MGSKDERCFVPPIIIKQINILNISNFYINNQLFSQNTSSASQKYLGKFHVFSNKKHLTQLEQTVRTVLGAMRSNNSIDTLT